MDLENTRITDGIVIFVEREKGEGRDGRERERERERERGDARNYTRGTIHGELYMENYTRRS